MVDKAKRDAVSEWVCDSYLIIEEVLINQKIEL